MFRYYDWKEHETEYEPPINPMNFIKFFECKTEHNIFENAYFGKSYRTRDGKKALYSGKGLGGYHLLFFNNACYGYYDDNGKYVNARSANNIGDYYEKHKKYEIVSEWKNEINK